ncbi:MAG: hypothetical protein ACW992_12165 [Candidatus Thorarchaeota archaeon]|jgi:hypothetical protein
MVARPVWDKNQERFIVKNEIAWPFYMLLPLCAVLAGIISIFVLPVHYICFVPCPALILVLAFSGAVLWYYYLRLIIAVVDLRKDSVVLKGLFTWKRIYRRDVSEVVLSPNIESPDLDVPWSQQKGNGTVHKKNGEKVILALLHSGTLYRIAGVLDPENHPEKAEWVEDWFLEAKYGKS